MNALVWLMSYNFYQQSQKLLTSYNFHHQYQKHILFSLHSVAMHLHLHHHNVYTL